MIIIITKHFHSHHLIQTYQILPKDVALIVLKSKDKFTTKLILRYILHQMKCQITVNFLIINNNEATQKRGIIPI